MAHVGSISTTRRPCGAIRRRRPYSLRPAKQARQPTPCLRSKPSAARPASLVTTRSAAASARRPRSGAESRTWAVAWFGALVLEVVGGNGLALAAGGADPYVDRARPGRCDDLDYARRDHDE